MEEYYNVVPVAAVIGTFDLTDEYYRMLGEDPYRYEKARFLSTTFEMRIKMAAESPGPRLATLAARPAQLRLDRLWKDTGPSHPARAVSSSARCSTTSAAQEKSREARNVIETFVRLAAAASAAPTPTPPPSWRPATPAQARPRRPLRPLRQAPREAEARPEEALTW